MANFCSLKSRKINDYSVEVPKYLTYSQSWFFEGPHQRQEELTEMYSVMQKCVNCAGKYGQ